jgi:hypothetical protein
MEKELKAKETPCPEAQASLKFLACCPVAGCQPEISNIFAPEPDSKYGFPLSLGPTPTTTTPAKTQAGPHPSGLPQLGAARSSELQRGGAPAADLSEPAPTPGSSAGRHPPATATSFTLRTRSENSGSGGEPQAPGRQATQSYSFRGPKSTVKM